MDDNVMTTAAPGDIQNSSSDDSEVHTWTVVSSVLGVVLFLLLVGSAVYVVYYHRRYGLPDWLLCRTAKPEGIHMGYIPADITVNDAAVEQGVPNIFLRNSQSGRISMEPSSVDIAADVASGVESSGNWAEYLRATLSMRRTAASRASSERRQAAGQESRTSDQVNGKAGQQDSDNLQIGDGRQDTAQQKKSESDVALDSQTGASPD